MSEEEVKIKGYLLIPGLAPSPVKIGHMTCDITETISCSQSSGMGGLLPVSSDNLQRIELKLD